MHLNEYDPTVQEIEQLLGEVQTGGNLRDMTRSLNRVNELKRKRVRLAAEQYKLASRAMDEARLAATIAPDSPLTHREVCECATFFHLDTVSVVELGLEAEATKNHLLREAIAAGKKAVEISPRDASMRTALANAYVIGGDRARALEQYKAVRDIDEKAASALFDFIYDYNN